METKYRFAFTPVQKTILWIGFVLVVWRYLQIPEVVNAILMFCASGQIPGTNIILSPDTVLWLVFGACASGAAILFYRLFLGGSRAYAESATRPVVYRAPSRRVRHATRPSRVMALLRRLLPVMQRAWRATTHMAVKVFRTLLIVFKIVAIELWTAFEPYARRIDDWLRTVLNEYAPTATALSIVRGITTFMRDIARKSTAAHGTSQSERG